MAAERRALAPAGDDAAVLERRAAHLAGLTIAWNVAEALVAVSAGVAAGSIALVGFGLDSTVEVFASAVVLWRLRGLGEERERRALRLIAASFFALAAYVAGQAVVDLLAAATPAVSPPGIALAVASVVVMPVLGAAKRRTGRRLGSGAVVADGAETVLCAYLSAVLLAGLVLNATVGWWWADPVAALVIAVLAVREGVEAWSGDAGCC